MKRRSSTLRGRFTRTVAGEGSTPSAWGGLRRAAALASLLAAAACTRVGTVPEPGPLRADGGRTGAVVPRLEPPSRSGNMVEYVQSGRRYRVMDTSRGYEQEGIASWYGRDFHGRPTSSGEPYDMYDMTAAHRTLPLPTYVEVTNLANGRSVIVRVNDRGPFHDPDRRIIDVSYAAAVELGIVATGTAPVRVRALEPWQTRTDP